MAPLALTLALLPLAVATAAIEVVPLDMAPDSFDDQYRGCGPAMTKELPALNRSEFEKNPLFARGWKEAVDVWQSQGSPVSSLSPDQVIAILTCSVKYLYEGFNEAVLKAGSSGQEYRDNFHFKTLHFLQTQALGTLNDAQKGQCQNVVMEMCGVRYEAQTGATVRFGFFILMALNDITVPCVEKKTRFQVYTCHGANIEKFFENLPNKPVLIPPFETFEVTKVTEDNFKTQLELRSTGTHSNYNCEWLKGGSEPRAPFHLGGLLLATTALAVATGML